MKKVVKSLILNTENKILLIQRAANDSHAGSWETPGGGVDGDETLLQACIREVKEEAGVELDHAFFAHDLILPDSETGEHFDVSFFTSVLDTDVTPDLSQNPDHQGFKWATAEEIRSLNIDTWTQAQLFTSGII